jgi:hypothetical protein
MVGDTGHRRGAAYAGRCVTVRMRYTELKCKRA